MSPNTRALLVAAANLLAIFLVIGVLSTMNNNSDKDVASAAKTPVATMAEMSIPTTTSGGSTRNRRDLRAKGDTMVGSKGKGKGSEDCIPLYPTPAPSKGKGTSLMKGSSNSTKGSGLSFKGKGSSNSTSFKGKGSSNSTSFKGKGSSNSTSFKGKGSSSMAPSYYCSDAPSVAPSTSVAPSVSSAPTCSGKGSCKMSSKGGGKGKSMMP